MMNKQRALGRAPFSCIENLSSRPADAFGDISADLAQCVHTLGNRRLRLLSNLLCDARHALNG
jgi:hypothetical protein